MEIIILSIFIPARKFWHGKAMHLKGGGVDRRGEPYHENDFVDADYPVTT